MIMGPSYWDVYPDAFSIAKKMWKAGRTANLIAKLLSVKFDKITRSAIMGKMNRHGLSRIGASCNRHITPQHKKKHCKKLRIKEELVVIAPVEVVSSIGMRDLPLERPSTMISLYDIGAFQCRWPAGDAHELMFCGATVDDDASYTFCPRHLGRATSKQYKTVNSHGRLSSFRYR